MNAMEKIKLFHNVTDCQKLNYSVGGTTIYMKRDDLLDFGFGGNKVRLFEYIAADVIRSGAKKIITFGSMHSNHIRVAAATANIIGVGCDLILLCDTDKEIGSDTPNLKLVNYCGGAHVEYCRTNQAHDFIDEYLEREKAKGTKFYWIPGGGHTALAAMGYCDAAREIIEQMGAIHLDAVFVPCGTGTTQAGLISGFEGRVPVYGITVARDTERCIREICILLNDIPGAPDYDSQIKVLPSSVKYGVMSDGVCNMISALTKSDGIFLDPVYNAKSFLGMTEYLKTHPGMKNVLYVNTGGSPNLFE